jgi:hypothetical protein
MPKIGNRRALETKPRRKKMTKWTGTKTVAKTSLATSLAVVAAGASGIGIAGATYSFKGSDTLTEVVRDAINGAVTAGAIPANTFDYINTGSGKGEADAKAGLQAIVPMSRNFTADIIGDAYAVPPTTGTHNNWNPGLRNVIGLDAAVMVERLNGTSYTPCRNLLAPIDTDGRHAVQDSVLGLVLGGVGGEGSTEACRDQKRLDAIDQLAQCFKGVTYLEHFYRRDDRSGTADTFKERLRVKRFCNGRAPGVDSAGNDYNMNNDDADPVRRACVAADSTHAATPCTLWPTTTQCTGGTGCTQGFLVALSQRDPDASTVDITTSIAARVRNDPYLRTVGFAGREASKWAGNTAPMVNSVSSSDVSTRNGKYFLSRRLFVQWAAGNLSGDRLTQETALYNWMTDPDGDIAGRYNVDPLLTAHGFLPCMPTRGQTPVSTSNLCNSETPIRPAETTPKQCIPAGATGNAADICCATGTTSPASPGTCPTYNCAAVTVGCATNADCCGSPAGMTCQELGNGHLACCIGPTETGQDCAADSDCCTGSCNTTTNKCN